MATTPLTSSEAKRSLLWAGAGAAVLIVSALYAPGAQSGPTLCVFRWFTGLPCPGCGLTRSFCAITEGDWGHALHFHALGPLLLGALLLAIPLLTAQGLLRRRVPALRRVMSSRRSWWVLATALIAYHLVRLMVLAWQGELWAGMKASAAAQTLRWLGDLAG